MTGMTIGEMQSKAWGQSERSGFHEDIPPLGAPDDKAAVNARVNYAIMKLFLIVTEVAEAGEELRDGHAPEETYYKPEKPGKPEGLPSELADVVIRVGDLCGILGINLEAIIAEKMAYNATRERLHGRKF